MVPVPHAANTACNTIRAPTATWIFLPNNYYLYYRWYRCTVATKIVIVLVLLLCVRECTVVVPWRSTKVVTAKERERGRMATGITILLMAAAGVSLTVTWLPVLERHYCDSRGHILNPNVYPERIDTYGSQPAFLLPSFHCNPIRVAHRALIV